VGYRPEHAASVGSQGRRPAVTGVLHGRDTDDFNRERAVSAGDVADVNVGWQPAIH
jgi:hypothetical protein